MTDYLTTYRKSYQKKTLKPTIQARTLQEFSDPITEGHKRYLFLQKSNLKPPAEDGEVYFEKFKEKYKDVKYLQKFIDKPLGVDVIKRREAGYTASEYQVEFCDFQEDPELVKMKSFHLPDDTVIQLTTQRASYKRPLDYSPTAMDPPRVIIYPNDIERDNHNPLYEKTGVTEYADVIGAMGEFILEKHLEKAIREGRVHKNN